MLYLGFALGYQLSPVEVGKLLSCLPQLVEGEVEHITRLLQYANLSEAAAELQKDLTHPSHGMEVDPEAVILAQDGTFL